MPIYCRSNAWVQVKIVCYLSCHVNWTKLIVSMYRLNWKLTFSSFGFGVFWTKCTLEIKQNTSNCQTS